MTLEGLFAVTGGGSGIGAGVARALHEAGGDIAVLDLDGTKAKAIAETVGGAAYEVDVSDSGAVDELFDSLGPLRGLVNCAGIAGEIVPLVACSDAEWNRVTGIHLDGTFFCLRAAARNMLRGGVEGTIVNTSSVNAMYGHRGLGAYSASKAGISMLTRIAALELAASGIRVNAVAPGIVATGMTQELIADAEFVRPWIERNPFRRVGEPADIADIVVFLSSDESRWLVGQTLASDGGTSLRVEPPMHPDEAWTRDALVARLSDGPT
jgi:NAD(P)-dependent dehydrogenase (short-subunit alcohol dehydrogenase family)